MTKIGLFFGSFNPVHIGHLIIANVIAETTDLKKVWFVVSPRNPFKSPNTLLHEFDRYDMVRAALYDNPRLDVTDVEFNLPRPSYTIHTLVHLREKHPDKSFHVIVGEDNLENFTRWRNHEVILNDFGLYVYPRPAVQPSNLRQHPNVKMVDSPLLDISASFIRECIRKDQSIKYLVPDAVEALIKAKGHYR